MELNSTKADNQTKNTRKGVLIYPGNGYNAEMIFQCLNDSLRYRPFLGNHGNAHAQYMTEDFYADFPLVNDENFLEFLNRFINEKEISFIIPTHDTVADVLMRLAPLIDAVVVCSCAETADICRHKLKTYEVLQGESFLPQVYTPTDKNIDFPVFIKDDIGQGGQRSSVIYSMGELENKIASSEIKYLITEYLPGQEISIDCFTDRHGILLFCQPRIRETVLNGMSGRSVTTECTEDILSMAKTINDRISFRGYWYFQCKQDKNGHYKLMEISTRFAGTFSLSMHLDVNLPLLALTDFDGIDVKIVPNKYQISSDRGYVNHYKVNIIYDRVYFDFDDTLVYKRERFIIPTIAFLFQCINEKKEVFILTRHSYDIYETLKKLKIDKDLFTDVIEVAPNKKKSAYIKMDKKSILIDNSFAERLDVKSKLKIPTFDVCNLECLIHTFG